MSDSMNDDHSLAYELLTHLKANARRWFVIAMVELFIIIGIVGAFLWYISLPSEEYEVTVENTDGNANYIGNDMNGDIHNGED